VLGAGSALGDVRLKILSEVAALCAEDRVGAAVALKLPAGAVDDACVRNAGVFDCYTMPALDRYTGVLYDGLDVASMTRAMRRAADASVLVFSGGLGIVRGSDLVPWYRVPASARLPIGGTVAASWRGALASEVPAVLGDRFVVDLRSSDYAGLWRPPAGRVVAIRVLQQRKAGRKRVEQVVSYHSKLVKGHVARALVEAAARRRPAKNADDVGRIAAGLGLDVRPLQGGLDLVDIG